MSLYICQSSQLNVQCSLLIAQQCFKNLPVTEAMATLDHMWFRDHPRTTFALQTR